jgi:hypothetical protein
VQATAGGLGRPNPVLPDPEMPKRRSGGSGWLSAGITHFRREKRERPQAAFFGLVHGCGKRSARDFRRHSRMRGRTDRTKGFSVHRPERRANAFKWHPAGWGERRHPRPDERCLINECFRLGIYFVADGNPCQETDGRSCPDIPFLQRLHLAPSGKIPLRNQPYCSERLSTSMRTALHCLRNPPSCNERLSTSMRTALNCLRNPSCCSERFFIEGGANRDEKVGRTE